jgi:hypothetical protein
LYVRRQWKVDIAVIWIKRVSPLLAIILLWFAYSIYTQRRDDALDASDHKIARLSAQVWLASALYRENPEQYRLFRDSLLHANGLDDASMKQYVASIQHDPDRQYQFSVMLAKSVDSLVKIEDSLRKATSPVIPAASAPAPVSAPVARDSLLKIVAQSKLPATATADSIHPR